MSQTSYSQSPSVAYEGQVDDAREVIDCIVNSTNGAVKFGRAVTFRTLPAPGAVPTIELPDATGEITGEGFAGIVIKDHNVEIADGSTEFSGYTTGQVCSVLRRGRIYVKSESAISSRQQLFARFSAAGAEELGALRHDADTADAVAIPGSRALTTFGVAGIGLMELDVQD
jgi:hypothetical protein